LNQKINQKIQAIKKSKELLDEITEKFLTFLDKIIRPIFKNHVIVCGLLILLSGYLINSIVSLAFIHSADKEIASMYATVTCNVMLAVITLYYVVLTSQLVKITAKEQKTKDLERRLEKFYIPAIDKLNKRTRFAYVAPKTLTDADPILIERAYKEIVVGSLETLGKGDEAITINHKGFYKINKYRHLAYKSTSEKFEAFVQNKSKFMVKTEDIEDAIRKLKIEIEKDIKEIEHELKQIKK